MIVSTREKDGRIAKYFNTKQAFTNVNSKSSFGSMSVTNKYLLAIGVLVLVFVVYKKKKLNFFGKKKN